MVIDHSRPIQSICKIISVSIYINYCSFVHKEGVNQNRRYSVIHDPNSPDYIVQEPRLDAKGEDLLTI